MSLKKLNHIVTDLLYKFNLLEVNILCRFLTNFYFSTFLDLTPTKCYYFNKWVNDGNVIYLVT